MGFRIIDSHIDACRLNNEGLLWYSPMQSDTREHRFLHPIPWYYAPSSPFTSIPGVTYAVYLEE